MGLRKDFNKAKDRVIYICKVNRALLMGLPCSHYLQRPFAPMLGTGKSNESTTPAWLIHMHATATLHEWVEDSLWICPLGHGLGWDTILASQRSAKKDGDDPSMDPVTHTEFFEAFDRQVLFQSESEYDKTYCQSALLPAAICVHAAHNQKLLREKHQMSVNLETDKKRVIKVFSDGVLTAVNGPQENEPAYTLEVKPTPYVQVGQNSRTEKIEDKSAEEVAKIINRNSSHPGDSINQLVTQMSAHNCALGLLAWGTHCMLLSMGVMKASEVRGRWRVSEVRPVASGVGPQDKVLVVNGLVVATHSFQPTLYQAVDAAAQLRPHLKRYALQTDPVTQAQIVRAQFGACLQAWTFQGFACADLGGWEKAGFQNRTEG